MHSMVVVPVYCKPTFKFTGEKVLQDSRFTRLANVSHLIPVLKCLWYIIFQKIFMSLIVKISHQKPVYFLVIKSWKFNEVLANESWFTVYGTRITILLPYFVFTIIYKIEVIGFFICILKIVCDFIVVESMGFIFLYSVCVSHVLVLFSDNSSSKKSWIKDFFTLDFNIEISQVYRKSEVHVF